MMLRRLALPAVLFASALGAACSGGSSAPAPNPIPTATATSGATAAPTPTATATPTATPSPTATPTPTATPLPASNQLFVLSQQRPENGFTNIQKYTVDQNVNFTTAPGSFSSPSNAAFASVAAAGKGNVVYLGFSNGVVERYASGATTPSASVTIPGQTITALAEDSSGLWVATSSGGNAHFPNGPNGPAAPADRAITGIGGVPSARIISSIIAVDSHDRVYVSDGSAIYEMPANSSGAPVPVATYPNGGNVQIDRHTDTVWAFGARSLFAYPQGATTPSRTITYTGQVSGSIISVAFDDYGHVYALYTANISGGSPSEYLKVYQPTDNGNVSAPGGQVPYPALAVTVAPPAGVAPGARLRTPAHR